MVDSINKPLKPQYIVVLDEKTGQKMGQKQAIFDPRFLPILQMTSGFGQMTNEKFKGSQ